MCVCNNVQLYHFGSLVTFNKLFASISEGHTPELAGRSVLVLEAGSCKRISEPPAIYSSRTCAISPATKELLNGRYITINTGTIFSLFVLCRCNFI